jgi:MATE family multidrug resistance protein
VDLAPNPPAFPPDARLLRHVGDLLRLAAPVVVARSGVMVMALVDTVMVGRFSSEELAYLGIGLAPTTTLLLAILGLVMGTLVLTASAYGGGRHAECGRVWRRSLPYAFILGAVAATVAAFGETVLTLLGQSGELARDGGRVMRIVGLGLPPYLLFLVTSFFLEGIRRPLPGMLVMIAGNLLNVLLNWLWIYGHLGFPAMGAEGSAWATTTVRAFLAAALIAYVWTFADHHRYGVRQRPDGGWRSWARQRRIGYAAGASIAVESTAFSTMSVFAGWLGTYPLAAYSIAHNLLATVFMAAVGIAAATAVRVGIAHGQGDRGETAWAGWTGLAVNSLVMAAFGILFAAAPEFLARVYTGDTVLALLAAPVIAFCAWVLVADGGQVVLANALRGLGETWVATGLHVISYLVVMVPLAWLLAFPFGGGVGGLFQAVLVASVVSLLLLGARFWWLAARAVR